MSNFNFGRQFDYNHLYVPTCEDVLDVNFRSIVSDLRAIVSGTLVPRTWADISETWSNTKRADNHGRYQLSSVTQKRMSDAGKARWARIKRGPTTVALRQRESHVRKLTKLLIAGGKNAEVAGTLARAILGED